MNVKARDAKLFDPIGDPTAAAGGSWCLVGVGASSGGQFSTWARVWSLGVDVCHHRAQNSTLERRRARRRDHDPRSPRRACKIVTADTTRARVDAHPLQRAACRADGAASSSEMFEPLILERPWEISLIIRVTRQPVTVFRNSEPRNLGLVIGKPSFAALRGALH